QGVLSRTTTSPVHQRTSGVARLSRWVSTSTPGVPSGTETGAPGVSLDGARWLADRRVRASGADTVAYEHMPSPSLDVHVHLLVEREISIMEAMNLEPLVAAAVWSFFFVAAPLSIQGGIGRASWR